MGGPPGRRTTTERFDMSAAITAARALTTGTMIAATAASVGIGVHLAGAHTGTVTQVSGSSQTYQPSVREYGESRSRDDDGGLLGGLLQGSTSQGSTAQGGTSSGVTGGAMSQTHTRGS